MHTEADWIERQAWTDLAGASSVVRAEPIGDTLVLRSTAEPSLLFNRMFGLRADRPGHGEHLRRGVDGFRRRRIARFFIQLPPGAADLERWLSLRGIQAYRRPWIQLARGRNEPLAPVKTTLRIRPGRPEDREAVADLFAAGFDLTPRGGAAMAAVLGRPGWTTLVATDGDRLASASLLFEQDQVAYLAGGVTHPAARRRGAQGALMRARCELALERGARCIVSETGAPAPGDPQHSHRNMERCGLSVIGTRNNYAPVGTRWGAG